MAIGTPTASGTDTTQSGVKTTVTISPNRTIAVGELVVLLLGVQTPGSNNPVASSLSDNSGGGNSWQVDATAVSNLSNTVSVCSCVLAGQITSSTTITVTLSGASVSGSKFALALFDVSGIASTSWRDLAGTAKTGTTTALSTTANGNTSNASEIIVGAWTSGGTAGGSTDTPGAGYTALSGLPLRFSGGNDTLYGVYQIFSTTQTSPAPSDTSSTTGTIHWSGNFASYQAPAAVAAGHRLMLMGAGPA